MNKIRLGVNIDHVATVRKARGETYPSPLKAALLAERYGADSVTIHLREDRRHINDNDLKLINSKLKIPLNLEIAATSEMLRIATKRRPKFICIVPEKRKEITTEGGLNLKKNLSKLKNIVYKLKDNRIRTSLFINPNIRDIYISKDIGADCVELHTGKISRLIKNDKNIKNEYSKINKCSKLAHKLGLEVHAGHGMDYDTAKLLSKIDEIKEFNIGHFIVGESIFFGLKKTIKKFLSICK